MTDASTTHCDVVKVSNYSIANVYQLPSAAWHAPNLLPSLPHPAICTRDLNCHNHSFGGISPQHIVWFASTFWLFGFIHALLSRDYLSIS